MNQRTQTARLVMGMAEAFGKSMNEAGLRFYLDGLADLSPEAVNGAISDLGRSSKGMPTIAEIRAKADPKQAVTDEQRAVVASNRIVEAMSKFGWTQPQKAREFIGELGWAIVEREGGWTDLCERTKNDELPILKAQWRELGKGIAAMSRAGVLETPIGLPRKQEHKLLEEK